MTGQPAPALTRASNRPPRVAGIDIGRQITRDLPARPSHAAGSVPERGTDIVDEWGKQSFPASDPPANW